MSYAATIDGVTKSFAEWGFEQAGLTLTNGGRDVARLSQALASVREPGEIADEARATVTRTGVPIFSGRVLPRARTAGGAVRGTIEIAGGWYELERRQYCQPWVRGFGAEVQEAILAQLSGVTVGEVLCPGWVPAAGTGVPYGRVYLGADAATCNPATPNANLISTGAQIAAVLSWAISQGAPLQVGTIDAGVRAPLELVQDITCAEAIARCWRYTPGAVVWFDYSQSPPAFNFRTVENLSGVELAVTEFEQEGFSNQRAAEGVIKGVVLNYKVEARRKGADIVIRLRTGETVTIPASALALPDLVTADFARFPYPAEAVEGQDGVVSLSLDDVDWGLEDGATLAEAMYREAAAIGWRGTGTLVGADVPQTLGLGKRLNLTDGPALWRAMATPVQQCEDNLLTGRRRVTWGAPRRLTSSDVAALLNVNRRRTAAPDDARAQQATGGSEESWTFTPRTRADAEPGFGELTMTALTTIGWQRMTVKAREIATVAPLLADIGALPKLPQVENGVWSFVDPTAYMAGSGIDITAGVISVDVPTYRIALCGDEIEVLTAPPA